MATLTLNSIQPLPGYVVVQPQEAKTQTESGIFLASGNEEKPQMGTVIAVSEKFVTENGTEVKCPVKKGDTVLYKKWGGQEVKVGKEELQVMKYEDLIATVK